jgi:hypothetical protein
MRRVAEVVLLAAQNGDHGAALAGDLEPDGTLLEDQASARPAVVIAELRRGGGDIAAVD